MKKAFTLVETLIAITVLTLAVAGPLVTASRAIVAAQIASDQLTASYLAQEGIEYVRAARDDAYLAAYQTNAVASSGVSGLGWSNFLAGQIQSCISQNCSLDVTASGFSMSEQLTTASCPVGNSACNPLYLATYLGIVQFYSQTMSSGAPTIFSRTIRATGLPSNANPQELRISSTVAWTYHGHTYSVVVYDNLTPWQ
jgi:type II secretory pathway pseudopilin PulG